MTIRARSRIRFAALRSLSAVLLVACGGSVQKSGGAAAGASNGGAAGVAGAVMSDAGGPSAGAGGGAGAVSNSFPCQNPIDLGNGFTSCDGFTHRSGSTQPGQQADACASTLPRPEPYPNPPANAFCKSDADCTALPHGWCGLSVDSSSPVLMCNYGCVQDGECGLQVCLCGDPVGRCVQPSCRSDSECGPGFLCERDNSEKPCGPNDLACQSAADECGSNADCVAAGTGNLCRFDFGGVWHRVCLFAACAD